MEFSIIVKKIYQNLSKSEEKIFEDWYNESEEHRQFYKNVKSSYLNTSNDVSEMQKNWADISKRISNKRKVVNYQKYIAVAAVFVLLFSIPFISDLILTKESTTTTVVTHQELPVYEDVVLITDNQKEIILDKNNTYTSNSVTGNSESLVYHKKTKETTKSINYNYLTIPKGKQFVVTLSDGTKVWLNSGSKLKYPTSFLDKGDRIVELLYGEAFFEVTSSDLANGNSFIVLQANQKIEVLGTKFNVKSYPDESIIETTLVEGSIALQIENINKILKPNQQLTYDKSKQKALLKKVDADNTISWTSGIYRFNNKKLEEVLVLLSRWYNLTVQFENEEYKELVIRGVINRDNEVNSLLDAVLGTQNIKYHIKNNTIYIY